MLKYHYQNSVLSQFKMILQCRPARRFQIDGLIQRLQQQACSHRIRILLGLSSRLGPEFRLQMRGLCVQSVEPCEIISRSPVLHPNSHVLAKKLRDFGACRCREELRTQKGCTDGVGLFQHKLLADLESRHRHRHRESQQECENAKYGGLDSRNLRESYSWLFGEPRLDRDQTPCVSSPRLGK